MKKTKKAFIGITAIVMAFSVTALSACTPGGGDDSGDKGGNGAGKAVTVKVLDAYKNQTVKGIAVNSRTESNKVLSGYESDEDGKKLPDAEEETQRAKTVETTVLKSNGDLANLNADDYTSYELNFLKESGEVDTTLKGEKDYTYSFVRGGKMFSCESEKEVTDFSTVTLTYDGGLTDELPEGVTIDDVLGQLEEAGVAPSAIPVSLILNLASDFKGTSFKNNTLTVDFNKVTYNIYNSVLEVIEGLDENTTVGDLVGAKPVKALIEALTYGIGAKTVYDEVLASFKIDAAMLKGIPAPAEKEAVYDYLVRLINSKEFSGFIIGMVTNKLVASVVAPFAEFKLADVMAIIAMIGGGSQGEEGGASPMEAVSGGVGMTPITMDQIKAMAKEAVENYVTATEEKFTISMEGTDVEVSGLTIAIEVNGKYEISAIDVTGAVKTQSAMLDGYDGEYMVIESATDAEFTYSVNFAASDLVYEDISDCNVVVNMEELEEGVYYADYNYKIGYFARITVNAENEVVGFELTESYGGEAVGTADETELSVTVDDLTVTFDMVAYGYAYVRVDNGGCGAELQKVVKVSEMVK